MNHLRCDYLIMVRSNEDKVEMIMLYGEARRNLHETVRLFNAAYPDRPVDRAYVRQLVSKFRTTFSVKDAPRSGRPCVTTEEAQVAVLASVAVNPHASVRSTALEVGISKNSVHRVLKKHKFHPYKIQLHQEINDDDPDRRLQFCEEMIQQIENNRPINYISQVCFSDEASFSLHGTVNRHNCRYWSDNNPHWMVEAHTQRPQKLNVWAGILGETIVGPFFIEGNLNGVKYLEMLQEHIVPAINEIVQGTFNPVFQQDGAPPHYNVNVRTFLDQQFPGQWIGRRGAIEWPPRSPDLAPLDFFFWGFLKSKVYVTKPQNLDDLRIRIENACQLITPEMLRNVQAAFESRLYFCQEVNGGHFEQLI